MTCWAGFLAWFPVPSLLRVANNLVVLDWSDGSHAGRERRPCRVCRGMTWLRDVGGRACHKVCAEAEVAGVSEPRWERDDVDREIAERHPAIEQDALDWGDEDGDVVAEPGVVVRDVETVRPRRGLL